MQTSALPRLMFPAAVAEWLGWPVARVQRMARQGTIPARTLPDGEMVFDAAELAEWLRALPRSGGRRDD